MTTREDETNTVKVLAVALIFMGLVLLMSVVGCSKGESPLPTTTELTTESPAPGTGTTTPDTPSVAETPAPADPRLTAFIDKMDEACYVTNKTGQTQNVRFRVYQVNDESNPANVATQTLLWDKQTPVPNGSKDFRIDHGVELCSHLYQLDCGNILAYAFVRRTNPCPRPTPTPPPCVPEWKELEPEITYGDWSEWSQCSKPTEADLAEPNCVVEKCYQTRTRTKTTVVKEENSCTEETREKSRVVVTEKESKECECPKPPCVAPEGGVYPAQGNPTAECSYFGDYSYVDKDESMPWDLEDGTFYLIKAGQYMRLQINKPDRWQSLVEVDRWRLISHITVCTCR